MLLQTPSVSRVRMLRSHPLQYLLEDLVPEQGQDRALDQGLVPDRALDQGQGQVHQE